MRSRESQLPGTGDAGERGGQPRAGGDAAGLEGVQVGGCVGELRVGGQPPLAPSVRLPEGAGELLQLRAEREADVQVHAQRFQPLLQLAEGRPADRWRDTWHVTTPAV